MIHPAIDPNYPAGVSAFRNLIAGARPTFHANSWDLYHREGFDHLYYRGLALRHSNGETGKYETYTYEPSQTLVAWVAANRALPSFNEALAGRDTTREIRNMKWRARYAKTLVPARSVPSVASVQHQLLVELQGPLVTINEDGEASSRGLTDWYVREFCRINNLKVV